MKKLLLLILTLASQPLSALDCTTVAPFHPISSQEVVLTASRLFWKNGQRLDEEICEKTREVPVYDIQNREAEAYYCLKPLKTQTVSCPTKFNGQNATATIVPAIWIRLLGSEKLKAYRFHAYIENRKEPKNYLDIFSRTLSSPSNNQKIILEGSKVSGINSPSNEGYWFRLSFR